MHLNEFLDKVSQNELSATQLHNLGNIKKSLINSTETLEFPDPIPE